MIYALSIRTLRTSSHLMHLDRGQHRFQGMIIAAADQPNLQINYGPDTLRSFTYGLFSSNPGP